MYDPRLHDFMRISVCFGGSGIQEIDANRRERAIALQRGDRRNLDLVDADFLDSLFERSH